MTYSIFITPETEVYSDNVTDPMSSSYVQSIFSEQTTYESSGYIVKSLALDDGDTATVTLPGTVLADRKLLIIKVIGSVKVATDGREYDTTTPIDGDIHGYGTALFPGYILLTAYYTAAAIVIEATSDDTTVQVFLSEISV